MNPEVGLQVGQENSLPSDNIGKQVQAVGGDAQTDIREENVGGLAATEDSAGRGEVALSKDGAGRLLETVTASGDVEKEVGGPCEKLVESQLDELVDGSVLKELDSVECPLEVVGAGTGNEGHVLLHVAGVHVVAVMRELPGVVRHHERRVAEETNSIVELLVLGEGTVSTLVAENPEASADQALDEAVDGPGCGPGSVIGDRGDVGDGSPAESTNKDHIADKIAHGSENSGLEAVLGNSAPDCIDVREFGLLRHAGSRGRCFVSCSTFKIEDDANFMILKSCLERIKKKLTSLAWHQPASWWWRW